ncbi:MAG TPA: hypothetical protein VN810_01290, partial [Terriglobales bacterium]|nr:hypothetical protein [Terriglobales bacterium]
MAKAPIPKCYDVTGGPDSQLPCPADVCPAILEPVFTNLLCSAVVDQCATLNEILRYTKGPLRVCAVKGGAFQW